MIIRNNQILMQFLPQRVNTKADSPSAMHATQRHATIWLKKSFIGVDSEP